MPHAHSTTRIQHAWWRRRASVAPKRSLPRLVSKAGSSLCDDNDVVVGPTQVDEDSPETDVGNRDEVETYVWKKWAWMTLVPPAAVAMWNWRTWVVPLSQMVHSTAQYLVSAPNPSAAQALALVSGVAFINHGAAPLMRNMHWKMNRKGAWERTLGGWLFTEVWGPTQVMFLVLAGCKMVDAYLAPRLNTILGYDISSLTYRTLAISWVLVTAKVLLNWKKKVVGEMAFNFELEGRRRENAGLVAANRVGTVSIITIAVVMLLQQVGFEVRSLLTVGGFGGLAVGLAGREILENLFAGFLIYSTQPFAIGDEVKFTGGGEKDVNGFVVDIGWYRTVVRSLEREVYAIPNSVFNRAVVLNITRKGNEFRFLHTLAIRLEDVYRVRNILQEMRQIIREDSRIFQKLHRRVFFTEITDNALLIHLSFYVEAANKDVFLSISEDLLLSFIECIKRNGAELMMKTVHVLVTERSHKTLLNPEDLDVDMVVDSTGEPKSIDVV